MYHKKIYISTDFLDQKFSLVGQTSRAKVWPARLPEIIMVQSTENCLLIYMFVCSIHTL